MLSRTNTAAGRIAALSGPKQQALSSLGIKTTSVELAIDCTVCGGLAMLSICQSDKNGNAGKPVARVRGLLSPSAPH